MTKINTLVKESANYSSCWKRLKQENC